MKRCLVISDSFKGTLSSPEICRIAGEIRLPGWQVEALPVADGGEGTTDCFLAACGGQRISVPVSGPFNEAVEGFYGLLPDGTAVVECAAAAGLSQAEGHPDPETSTTYGVGQLMAAALENGAKRIILGLGGSCTNDGGCGAAAAARRLRWACGSMTGRAAASCPPAARWRTSRPSTYPDGTQTCGPAH